MLMPDWYRLNGPASRVARALEVVVGLGLSDVELTELAERLAQQSGGIAIGYARENIAEHYAAFMDYEADLTDERWEALLATPAMTNLYDVLAQTAGDEFRTAYHQAGIADGCDEWCAH